MTINVSVSDAQSLALRQSNSRIHFDWGPDLQNYHADVVTRTEKSFPSKDELLELFGHTKNTAKR